MRAQKALLVFRKDWREISRNKEVILPIIVVPLIISILLPAITVLIPNITAAPSSSATDLDTLIKNLPQSVKEELSGMTAQQILIYVMSLYLFAPFFLIIPIMASSVIASDSFAGEKERKTMEALLATPLSDSELFLGKILVSFVPSMTVTIFSFLAYTAVIDLFSFQHFNGRLILPNPTWIMIIFGLAPALALTSIGLTVIISSRVRGFREAQQISGVLLIHIIMLILAQVSGAMILGPTIIAVLVGALVVIDIGVFYTGVKLFGREEILSKLS